MAAGRRFSIADHSTGRGRFLPSSCPFLVLPFPSPCCERKPFELTRTCVRMCVRTCIAIVYVFRARVFVTSFHIYAVRWTAYLLGRGRFIECGRRRSDSHVFTSRQFFHLAPLPSRTRALDVSGPTAGRLAISARLLSRDSLVSLYNLPISFRSVRLISRISFRPVRDTKFEGTS